MKFNLFRREPEKADNEALLNAITAVAGRSTPEVQRNMYKAFLGSTLLLAKDPDPESGSRPILLVTKDGQPVLPVFTDLKRLQKVFPDAKSVGALPAREICQLALKNEIYIVNINPQYGPGGNLLRDELEPLAQGRIPNVTTEVEPPLGEPTLIPWGNPKLPPTEIVEEILEEARGQLGKEPSVDEAYLILLSSEQRESTLAVALRFRPETNAEQKSNFCRQLVPALEAVANRPINIHWLDDAELKEFQARQEPFYRRQP